MIFVNLIYSGHILAKSFAVMPRTGDYIDLSTSDTRSASTVDSGEYLVTKVVLQSHNPQNNKKSDSPEATITIVPSKGK